MRENSQARDVNTFLWNGETVESSATSLSKNSKKEILETEDPLDKFSSCGALQHTCPLEQQMQTSLSTGWNPLPVSDRRTVGTRNLPGLAVKCWSGAATLSPLWGHSTRHLEITPWLAFFPFPSQFRRQSRLLRKAAQRHTNSILCVCFYRVWAAATPSLQQLPQIF